jgi:hypothetical protein
MPFHVLRAAALLTHAHPIAQLLHETSHARVVVAKVG